MVVAVHVEARLSDGKPVSDLGYRSVHFSRVPAVGEHVHLQGAGQYQEDKFIVESVMHYAVEVPNGLAGVVEVREVVEEGMTRRG